MITRAMRHIFAVAAGAVTVANGCQRTARPAAMTVDATDYAFTAPDTVVAGETAIAFRNKGMRRHEVKVIALRPGSVLRTVMPLAMIDSGWSAFREPTSGILTAGPGETTPGRLLIVFESGRTYLLVCSFADAETAPLHSQLGMIRALTVR